MRMSNVIRERRKKKLKKMGQSQKNNDEKKIK